MKIAISRRDKIASLPVTWGGLVSCAYHMKIQHFRDSVPRCHPLWLWVTPVVTLHLLNLPPLQLNRSRPVPHLASEVDVFFRCLLLLAVRLIS